MPYIEWSDDFSVRIPEIDDQHQKMFAIINELAETQSTGKNHCGNILKSLKEYAWNHFRFEEEYMRKIKYPGLNPHAEMHLNFYMQILDYIKKEKEGQPVLASTIMEIALNWLQNHILSEDKKYAIFAAQGPAKNM